MSEEQQFITEENRRRVAELHAAMESGDETRAREAFAAMGGEPDRELFEEVGAITRRLHESLTNIGLEDHLVRLAEDDLPEAQDRLNYVITLTEQAANRTLAGVESSVPYLERLQERSEKLLDRLQSRADTSDNEELVDLIGQIQPYLRSLGRDGRKVSERLTDILMAQEFQDITGQVLGRVIHMVREVEENLVDLLRITGERLGEVNPRSGEAPKGKGGIEAEGPVLPAQQAEDGVVSSQDEVDDLLSDLGF